MTNNIEENVKSKSEKLFTQSELSKLINKRLSRERRNNSSLSKVYKLLKELIDKKIINACSYAEAAKELEKKLLLLCNDENMNIDDRNVGNAGEKSENDEKITEILSVTSEETDDGEFSEEELLSEAVVHENGKKADDGKDEAKTVNLSESFGDELYEDECRDCTGESSEQGTDSVLEKAHREAYPLSEISQLFERFPENRAWRIITSPEFSDFCRGRVGGLCELYDQFCKNFHELCSLFDGEEKTESEHLLKAPYSDINPRSIISEYSSTGFSGRSASPSSDDGANLSPLQRKIAKSAGISYREYASMLREIPQYSKSDKRTLTKIRI